MQYLAHRGGPQWVSDGEPSDQAIDAALLNEIARRVGMDWFEADAQIQNHAPDEAEAEAARETVASYSDETVCKVLLAMLAQRRREKELSRAKFAVVGFIASLRLTPAQVLLGKTASDVMVSL
jgi:hypothetical protein